MCAAVLLPDGHATVNPFTLPSAAERRLSFALMETAMLNVNRLPNSTRLEIAAAIAEEVYSLELDEEALIHELRRYGFTQAYAEG